MPRTITHRYDDPLDLVWLDCARSLGWRVTRSSDVFASWDGDGTLTLSTPEHFDPDDSLAQLVLHEICHFLVEGPASAGRPDWGLENVDDRDDHRERACQRLQAALADRYGLRDFFGTTTDFRAIYDALPADPLAPDDRDPTVALARAGFARATSAPVAEPLHRALSRTAALAAIAREVSPDGSLWSRTEPAHPARLPQGRRGLTCGGCAWFDDGRCVQADAPVPHDAPDCARFEPPLTGDDCASCGACCREGYDLVPVTADEARAFPGLVARDSWGQHLPRPGGRCVLLRGGGEAPYRCASYADRPASCRELEPGSDGCLHARRRVGLSG